MKGLLVVILILVVAFFAVGTWQGWFSASAAEGRTTFTFNTDKFKRDWESLGDKVKSTSQDALTKVKQVGNEIRDDVHEIDGTLVAVNTEDKIATIRVGDETIELPYLGDSQRIDSLEGREVKATVETTANGAILSYIAER